MMCTTCKELSYNNTCSPHNLHSSTISWVASITGMASTFSFLAGGGPLSDMLSSSPDMMESRPRAPHTKSAGSLVSVWAPPVLCVCVRMRACVCVCVHIQTIFNICMIYMYMYMYMYIIHVDYGKNAFIQVLMCSQMSIIHVGIVHVTAHAQYNVASKVANRWSYSPTRSCCPLRVCPARPLPPSMIWAMYSWARLMHTHTHTHTQNVHTPCMEVNSNDWLRDKVYTH